MHKTRVISVLSCKYDGRVHRSWRAGLTRLEEPLIVLDGAFEEEIRHPLLGIIRAGTRSTEFFWTDRWYSVFRFREPSGELRNYYCNINTPPRIESETLTFIDLDIDVLVSPDFSYQVLDEDEFTINSASYAYPLEFQKNARAALDEVINIIEGRRFPFSADE